jgi:hypothetical protein
MALTEQAAAYHDCFLIWQKAVDTPGGIRLYFETYNQASTFQMRMNKARSISRRISTQIHPPSSPKHNTSEFDTHIVQCLKEPDPDGNWWIYVRPGGRLSLLERIEPISDTEPQVLDDVRAAEALEATFRSPVITTNPRMLTHAQNPAIHDVDGDLSGDLE